MWPGEVTRLMGWPPSCGAAAAIICSEDFAKKHRLKTDVRILAQSLTTDSPKLYDTRSMIEVVGFDMAQTAARQVYEKAGVSPSDIQVVELHDCFAHNELLTYESLGLCP